MPLLSVGLTDPLSHGYASTAEDGDRSGASLDHPLRKKVQSYVEFYMTPAKHAGYAVTWYVRCARSISLRSRSNPQLWIDY